MSYRRRSLLTEGVRRRPDPSRRNPGGGEAEVSGTDFGFRGWGQKGREPISAFAAPFLTSTSRSQALA
jgi:hypothetical protein